MNSADVYSNIKSKQLVSMKEIKKHLHQKFLSFL